MNRVITTSAFTLQRAGVWTALGAVMWLGACREFPPSPVATAMDVAVPEGDGASQDVVEDASLDASTDAGHDVSDGAQDRDARLSDLPGEPEDVTEDSPMDADDAAPSDVPVDVPSALCDGVADGTVIEVISVGDCVPVDGCTGMRSAQERVCQGGRVEDVSVERTCALDSPEEGKRCVPEGVFWMGCNGVLDSQCDPVDEVPQHLVSVSSFLIDTYEVSVSRYRVCVDEGVCQVPQTNDTSSNCFGLCNWGVDGRDDHPVNGLSWLQSREFCVWAGGDLPSEAQWEKSARGGCELYGVDCEASAPIYPWGQREPDCERAVFDDGRGFGCGAGYTSPVGSKPAGASLYGVEDMAGNLWEWTIDVYDATYYASQEEWTDPEGPDRDNGQRVIRGGTFSLSTFSLRASNRQAAPLEQARGDIGFRCVYGATP